MEQEGKDSSDAVVDTAVAAAGDGGAAGSASDGKDDTPASASASDSKSSTSGGGAGGAAGASASGASDGPESIVWPSAVASDGKDAETVTAATIADRLELHFTLPVFTTGTAPKLPNRQPGTGQPDTLLVASFASDREVLTGSWRQHQASGS